MSDDPFTDPPWYADTEAWNDFMDNATLDELQAFIDGNELEQVADDG